MPVATDGFQSFVNNELPIGVAGDFAGANIRASVIAPPGGFVAAAEGVTIGTFAWGDPASKIASNYYVPNALLGFVHRENQGLITNFLGISTFIVQPGHEITLQSQGDYLGIFASGATVGQKVYADPVLGTLTAAATGQGVTANSTAASLATTGILTVGATLTGTLAPGQAVYATGIPAGSYIGSQLSGTTGSTGTYQLINANGTAFPVVSSTTVYFAGVYETPFYVGSNVPVNATFTASIAAPVSPAVSGVMTVSAVAGGVLAAGQFLSATGLAASLNVTILSQLTATSPTTGGGTGTYLVSYSGGAVTSTNTFVGTAGQLGKITSWST
jgi:hypothetical protein